LDILEAVERDEAKCPGFFLGGNYRTGVAFGDCVGYGITESKRVADFLASK
jgi:oxygen-dependent protoporphyrinogen oxidase